MEIRMDRYKLKRSVCLDRFRSKTMTKTSRTKPAPIVVSSRISGSIGPPTSKVWAASADKPTIASLGKLKSSAKKTRSSSARKARGNCSWRLQRGTRSGRLRSNARKTLPNSGRIRWKTTRTKGRRKSARTWRWSRKRCSRSCSSKSLRRTCWPKLRGQTRWRPSWCWWWPRRGMLSRVQSLIMSDVDV